MLNVTFVRGIASRTQLAGCADSAGGDIALVGRSNVGKSSLINMIAGAPVARVSRTPGRTREINLFLVNDRFHLADLPGFGYAAGDQRERRAWGPLIESYVASRRSLRGFLLVMDARHFPLASDLDAAAWLARSGKPFLGVLTKCDQLSQRELAALRKAMPAFLAAHPHARGAVMVSSHTGHGVRALIDGVRALVDERADAAM